MKTSSFVVALTAFATLSEPAAAVTFPSLTTIYIGSGFRNTVDIVDAGVATSFHCTNASGLTASVRFLVLNLNGSVAGSFTQPALQHGRTQSVATHGTVVFLNEQATSAGTLINQGSIIIESTESGVFCTAAVVDAGTAIPAFAMPLHLVRVNAHPGTVD
jgi:hypothetical protein